jgi:hypothetical protein
MCASKSVEVILLAVKNGVNFLVNLVQAQMVKRILAVHNPDPCRRWALSTTYCMFVSTFRVEGAMVQLQAVRNYIMVIIN